MIRTILCALSLTLVATASSRGAEPLDYAGLAPSDLLGKLETVATVPTEKFFTEGPAWDGAGGLFFTNLPTPETAQILRFDLKAKTLSVFRSPSNAANGLHFDQSGRLVTCEGGLADDGRVTRTDLATGKVEVLADKYDGQPLGAPNDLAFDTKGRLYFTSRYKQPDAALNRLNAVYRLDADGTLSRIIASPEIDMPNGLVTSPDDKTLYVIDADGREGRSRQIRAYDLLADGTVQNARTLIDLSPGRSGDGMCIDSAGNLYVAAGLHKTRGSSETLATKPGIHVLSPEGKLLAYVPTPVDTITNCTFGGVDLKTLYVTCGPYLLAGKTRIAGKSLYRIPSATKNK